MYEPTPGLIRDMQEVGVQWPTLYRLLTSTSFSSSPAPCAGHPKRVRVCLGGQYLVYLETGRRDATRMFVTGVQRAEKVEPNVKVFKHKPKHKGRRGGIGNRWPTSWQEMVDLIERRNQGVTVETGGGGHLMVKRDGDLVVTLPKTASDHRALMNCCKLLERHDIVAQRAS